MFWIRYGYMYIWKFKYALRRLTFLINWLDEYIVCKLKNPTPILNYSISQSLKILGDKGTMVSTLSFIDTGVYGKHNWLLHVIPIFYIDQVRLHIERLTLHLSLQRTSFDHMHCLTTTYLQQKLLYSSIVCFSLVLNFCSVRVNLDVYIFKENLSLQLQATA